MSESIPRVVIVGGGFGGLAAAKALKNTPAKVTPDRPHESSLVSAAALSGGDVSVDSRADRFADPRRFCASSRTRRSSSAK